MHPVGGVPDPDRVALWGRAAPAMHENYRCGGGTPTGPVVFAARGPPVAARGAQTAALPPFAAARCPAAVEPA